MYGQSTYAVDEVNAQQPLFHLLNGDLCYANLNPLSQPEVWRDFGNNNQRSAAFRPWMPCPGNHELEFDNGPQGLDSYLSRYTLPDNGVPGFAGRWYTFRVGSVQFVSLAADDVIYQDAAAFVGGPSPLVPASSTGNPPIPPGTSLYLHGYSNGKQTAWLQRTLAAARAQEAVDWIVVQMHECALSSSTGNQSRRDASAETGGRPALMGLHTPGHTPGSQCFLVDGMLVAGDRLCRGALLGFAQRKSTVRSAPPRPIVRPGPRRRSLRVKSVFAQPRYRADLSSDSDY